MSIKLEGCNLTYMKNTPYAKQAVVDMSVEINKGEFVAIIGHTGSGKSSLIQLMNGLLTPDNGTVVVDGYDLSVKDKNTKDVKRTVGMVFQYPEHQLFAETVFEDVAFGPRNLNVAEEEIEQRVKEALDFVGLDYDTFKDRNPLRLSGGQMRRVAIAGVVAMKPDYLILDEPSAGLDPAGRRDLFKKILELHKKTNTAVILVTHNMDEAACAERLIVLDDGKILYDDVPKNIYEQHEKTLKSIGLKAPQLYQLIDVLKKCGMSLNDASTPESLVKSIKTAKGWK